MIIYQLNFYYKKNQNSSFKVNVDGTRNPSSGLTLSAAIARDANGFGDSVEILTNAVSKKPNYGSYTMVCNSFGSRDEKG